MKIESLFARTRRLLNQYGLRPRKGLAQNFLVDRGVLESTVAAAGLSPQDVVIEVGAGLGTLTRELAARSGRVVAIEVDTRLADILRDSLADSGNVTIVNEDILDVDIAALLESTGLEGSRYKVVANLPYYITQPVLRHFLESRARPDMVLVMVQQEVAQVITAAPGDMSILSVSVQLYGRPQIVRRVPAGAFYPSPGVDSALLRIDVYAQPAVPVEIDSFFQLVRAGFCAARKQLVNSLSQGLGVAKTESLPILERAGIAAERRAETLSLEEWGSLWQAWRERIEK